MSKDAEGILRMQPNGRWAIHWEPNPDGHLPYEVTSGEVIRIEVAGRDGLQPTRIEFAHRDGGGSYYSVDGYPLWEGMRAALRSRE
jgi:hypothetical protein